MQIFKTPNFDFLRWRWHAIALSWLVILAGLAVIMTKGLPLGVEFSGGTIVIVQFDQQPPDSSAVRAALERDAAGRGPERRHPALRRRRAAAVMIRVPERRRGSRAPASARPPTASSPRSRRPIVGNFKVDRHRDRRARRSAQDLQQKGILATVLSLAGILALHRVPVPVQLRRRRGRRDDARPARHARVPRVLPLRPLAQRHRRHPDGHRLLDQRHDRHLRPRAREHARHAARQLALRRRQSLGQPDDGPHGDHRRAPRC